MMRLVFVALCAAAVAAPAAAFYDSGDAVVNLDDSNFDQVLNGDEVCVTAGGCPPCPGC